MDGRGMVADQGEPRIPNVVMALIIVVVVAMAVMLVMAAMLFLLNPGMG